MSRWLVRLGFTGVGLLYALLLVSLAEACHAQTALTGPTRVIDGDTLEIQGRKVRLHGIDAPEIRQTCVREGKIWACGVALHWQILLIFGKELTVIKKEENLCLERLLQKSVRWLQTSLKPIELYVSVIEMGRKGDITCPWCTL